MSYESIASMGFHAFFRYKIVYKNVTFSAPVASGLQKRLSVS